MSMALQQLIREKGEIWDSESGSGAVGVVVETVWH